MKRLVCYHCYRPILNSLADAFDHQSCPIRPHPSYAIAPLHYNIRSLDWIADVEVLTAVAVAALMVEVALVAFVAWAVVPDALVVLVLVLLKLAAAVLMAQLEIGVALLDFPP